MLEWSANSPKDCSNKLVEESVVAEVGFSAPVEHRSVCCLFLYRMSGRGRGRGVLVVRPVRLPRLHPRWRDKFICFLGLCPSRGHQVLKMDKTEYHTSTKTNEPTLGVKPLEEEADACVSFHCRTLACQARTRTREDPWKGSHDRLGNSSRNNSKQRISNQDLPAWNQECKTVVTNCGLFL